MMGGVARPLASTHGPGGHPAAAAGVPQRPPRRPPSRASQRRRTPSPRRWVGSSPGSRTRAPSTGEPAQTASGVARRAADQLPRAMVLGTLLDRQADRVDPSLEFEPCRRRRRAPCASTVSSRACSGSPTASGRCPSARPPSRVAQAGWWVDIVVAAKGGFWHVLEVGSVYPERIVPLERDEPGPTGEPALTRPAG